jgi:hypothetical protein
MGIKKGASERHTVVANSLRSRLIEALLSSVCFYSLNWELRRPNLDTGAFKKDYSTILQASVCVADPHHVDADPGPSSLLCISGS